MKDKIIAWFKSHPVSAHSLAASVGVLFTLYESVPAFKALVFSAYSAMPHWTHQAVAAALGIWAFYHGTTNNQPK